MQQTVLLAPVPRQHIASARDRALESGGRVAFGTSTGKYEFFSTKAYQGMPVLVYVSTTGVGEYHGHVFSHRGVFDRLEAEEAKVAELRPQSAADTDTSDGIYWVVRDFERLPEAEFISFSKAGVKPPLRGPVVKTLNFQEGN